MVFLVQKKQSFLTIRLAYFKNILFVKAILLPSSSLKQIRPIFIPLLALLPTKSERSNAAVHSL
jgi:hypothetical protein